MYIHERADWPELSFQSEPLAKPLSEWRHLQGRILGQLDALGFSTISETMLESLTQDVVKSTAIEGEKLEYEQVRSSIAHRLGMDIASFVAPGREVEAMVEITLDATQNCQERLTRERLLGWHGTLFPNGRSGIYSVRSGQWRDDVNGPMQVVSGGISRERIHFQAPDAGNVPVEMDRFFAWLNQESSLDPILKAAMAHLHFVTIHPFDDGNGRIARALTDMLLARSDGCAPRFYSMSAQIMAERGEYYRILELTQKGELDITPWLLWFVACLTRALEQTAATIGNVLRKHRFWQRYQGIDFNPRHRRMIPLLLDGFEGKLTSTKWAKIAKCSADSALRDIQILLDQGILEKESGGGRSTGYRFRG